jgi:GNAT superfamily N-acetyltransferase
MTLRISEEPIADLTEHATVPIAFLVERVYDVHAVSGGLGGLVLAERTLDVPYEKDYDTAGGGSPVDWAKQFDVSNWGLLVARVAGQRAGGAVVAFNTTGVDMLEGRQDLAVLWDLRVRPESRRAGVGASLFAAAETWAGSRGCRWLKVETQNINVAACRFYRAQGCVLRSLDRFAYAEHPEETMLVWYKEIAARFAP